MRETGVLGSLFDRRVKTRCLISTVFGAALSRFVSSQNLCFSIQLNVTGVCLAQTAG